MTTDCQKWCWKKDLSNSGWSVRNDHITDVYIRSYISFLPYDTPCSHQTQPPTRRSNPHSHWSAYTAASAPASGSTREHACAEDRSQTSTRLDYTIMSFHNNHTQYATEYIPQSFKMPLAAQPVPAPGSITTIRSVPKSMIQASPRAHQVIPQQFSFWKI